jgi:uncharacterized protein (TIGR03083 family)
VDVSDLVDALQREGQEFTAAVSRGPLATGVPTCPGWSVGDLVRHVGFVHRWATHHVAEALTEMDPGKTEEEILADGPGDDDVLAWFDEGVDALVAALRAAPVNLACWTFLPAPTPLHFWARRQAHETAMHRVDAERAFPPRRPVAAALAADGIDELLMGFLRGERPNTEPFLARPLCVQTSDTGDAWTVAVRDGRLRAEVGRADAACTFTGPASSLYEVLWNRGEADELGVSVDGDGTMLAAWRAAMHVRWQ